MLKTVDRVQVVVADRAAAAKKWKALFDAKQVGEDASEILNVRRTTLQVGRSLFELLEPAGDGPVQAWASEWHEGLYGIVFSTADLEAMARHLNSAGIDHHQDGDAIVLDPYATNGMPASIVTYEEREEIGAISHLYEVTNPVNDWQDTAALYTRIFELDPAAFVPISSEEYGYTGTLTMFEEGRLDRIEITQTSGAGAMDRFFQRRGPSLYMCFAETPDVAALASKLDAAGARHSPSSSGEGPGLFIHPGALNGVLMGVSQTDVAWSWSGGKSG